MSGFYILENRDWKYFREFELIVFLEESGIGVNEIVSRYVFDGIKFQDFSGDHGLFLVFLKKSFRIDFL